MYMKLKIIIISIFFSISFLVKSIGILPLDTVMNRVMNCAEIYNSKIKSYEAEVYIKAFIDTKKKNFLYKYTNSIPNFVLHDLKNNQAIIETVNKIRFIAPNTFYQDVNYVTGTLTKRKDIALLPLKFLSMDLYDETVPGENFYLPLRKQSETYYNYEIESIIEEEENNLYTVIFTPKYKNPQLLKGYFVVEDKTWRVLRFNAKREDIFINHTFEVETGTDSLTNLLPIKFNIYQSYKYLGNHVINTFQAALNYKNVEINGTSAPENTYHLGVMYRVRLDSVPLNNDEVLWDSLRTIPLTSKEKEIYQRKKTINDNDSVVENKKNNAALGFAKNIVINTKYKHKSTAFALSGLLNPAMAGYSTIDGFTYKQTLNLSVDLERQQSIKVKAFAGYLFKAKQFRYEVSGVWNYEPWKLGYFSIAVGQGNPTYSSKFRKMLQDSIQQDLSSFSARYKDNYVRIFNSIELRNGLEFGTGIDYHVRQPIQSELAMMMVQPIQFKTQYHFEPKIKINWTPGQYYVTDGIQKVYVRSDYPTFKLEYAQSLRNVMKSNSLYSRVEFDVSQNIRFDLMKNLNYHIGIGGFVNQKDEYFNDFSFFAKNYFPSTWGDGFGGGFANLPYKTYNSSAFYAQAHLMYETPQFLLTQIPALSNGVARERIYLSQLYLPHKVSFTEIGYGIGNKFLNAAIFMAFDKWNYYNVNGKIVFLF